MLNRRNVLTSGAIAAVPLSFPAWAQSKKDTLALGLVLLGVVGIINLVIGLVQWRGGAPQEALA